jgi:lactoylglutathione lyase
MKLIQQRDYPSGKFTPRVRGIRRRGTNTIIELTYNWQTHQYDLGAIGHLAPGVKDIYKRATACPTKAQKIAPILV